MIRNDIKALVDRMGITRYRFWKDTGLSRETAYRLYDEPNYVPKKDVMEKLAETYGWQPGQYLYYDFSAIVTSKNSQECMVKSA